MVNPDELSGEYTEIDTAFSPTFKGNMELSGAPCSARQDPHTRGQSRHRLVDGPLILGEGHAYETTESADNF